jgi:hypothetical protein
MDTKPHFLIEPNNYHYYFFETVAGDELARRELRHSFSARFGYVMPLPRELSDRRLIASECDSKARPTSELREWGGGLVSINTSYEAGGRGHITITGFFTSQEEARRCHREVSAILPPEDESAGNQAVFVFWSRSDRISSRGPGHESKAIDVSPWQDLAGNYPVAVRNKLDPLMRFGFDDVSDQRIILWRGLPGTGKTWAIRALAREWTRCCSFHYIVVPGFFFADAGYMLRLLSNEELRNLHPAITRNGRCLSNIEFGEFEEIEARRWLAAQGKSACALPPTRTSSDLYACAKGRALRADAHAPRAAGFTVR